MLAYSSHAFRLLISLDQNCILGLSERSEFVRLIYIALWARYYQPKLFKMKKKNRLIFTMVFIVFVTSINAQTFSYDFSTGYDGWSGDFADYPVTDSIFYELEFTRINLPTPLNTSSYALMINGNNHSDDLFMFIKRKISGLLPNTTYQLHIDVEFASNAPTNAIGVGGPPGEGVVMKAGASVFEPLKIDSSGFYLMNIDKGNQAIGGVDMDTIGHVGVSDTTTVFTLINRNNSSNLFTITTDGNGEVWVCIGTDSGFEATTKLYYNLINLTFTNVTGLSDFNFSKDITLYPNPTSEMIKVKINPSIIGQPYKIIDQTGKQILIGNLTSDISNIDISKLSNGFFFLKIGEGKLTFKIIKN